MIVRRSWIGPVVAVAFGVAACAASGSGGGSDASSVSTSSPRGTTTTAAQRQDVIVLEAGYNTEARIVQADPETLEHEVISGDAQAHVPDLSADGTKVVWAGPSSTDPTWPDTFVRDLTTGKTTRIGSGGGPTWTDDQEALLVSRADGVYRMELDGSSELVHAGREISGREIGPGVYALGDEDSLEIVAGSDVTTVWEGDEDCGAQGWDLDRSGETLAFAIGCSDASDPAGGLYLYDLSSAETSKLLDQHVAGASWSPDSRSIVTTFRPDREVRQNELWVVDAATGEHEVLRSDGWSLWPVWREAP